MTVGKSPVFQEMETAMWMANTLKENGCSIQQTFGENWKKFIWESVIKP